mmetsp:Transcript_29120/g.28168  ORF Transcript_29120/g.28168 Transcript_29120/m.28168 type:complete len:164 (+) Transcript_29120:1961-2452(+)
MGYVLELTAKDSQEDFSGSDEDEAKSFVQQYSHSKKKTSLFGNYMKREMRNEGSEKVKSVTNEDYAHILYYPVESNGKVIAVIEVGYQSACEDLVSTLDKEKVALFLERFKQSLMAFNTQVNLFCSKVSALMGKKNMVQVGRAFEKLRQNKEQLAREEEIQYH